MIRSITTFANDYGSWSFDTGNPVPLELAPDQHATTLPEFLRLIHIQRGAHIECGLAYRITQQIIPEGGGAHEHPDRDRPAGAGSGQREEMGR